MHVGDTGLFVILFVLIVVVILVARTRTESIAIIAAIIAIAASWRRGKKPAAVADRLAEEDFDPRLTGGASAAEGFSPLPGGHPVDFIGFEKESAIRPTAAPQIAIPDNEAGLWGDPLPAGDVDIEGEIVDESAASAEGFASSPMGPADGRKYRGAIGDLSGVWTGADVGAQAEEYADREDDDNEIAPDGNPFSLGRLDAPKAAAPCVDDEANDSEFDIDEQNTYQVRARNDETRVAAGTMRRRQEMDKYFREELDETENREWRNKYEW